MERFEDISPLTLQMEGAMSQGIQVAYGGWKR